MPGRKPLGPQLAQHLEGSASAKERLEVILETIAGRLKVAEACARLGIGEAMFHRLRTEVLQAGLARLEPRPLGRPPRPMLPQHERVAALEHKVEDLQLELKTTRVQVEIAHAMPHVLAAPARHERTDEVALAEIATDAALKNTTLQTTNQPPTQPTSPKPR